MATTTVTATYLDPTGAPCRGRVTFQLVSAVYQETVDAIYPTVGVSAVLDDDGQISVELEPTSGVDAAFTATDMTYQVREKINGADRDAYYIDVPTAPGLDLGAVATYDDPLTVRRIDPSIDLDVVGYLTEADAEDIYVQIPPAGARVVYVTADGSDANDGLTEASGKATIAAALTQVGDYAVCIKVGVGEFTTSATHEIGTMQRVEGAGKGLTTITYTGTAELFTTSTPGVRSYNQAITGMSLDGPGVGSTAVAVDCSDWSNLTIDDFTATSFGTGYFCEPAVSGGSVYNRVNNGTFQLCGTGVHLRSGHNSGTFEGVKFGACGTAADVEDANGNLFLYNQFEANTTGATVSATLAGAADHNTLFMCRFEGNTLDWEITGTNVRDNAVLWPHYFGGYTYTDDGYRTTHTNSGGYENHVSSTRDTADGSWLFDRITGGASETPAMRIVDSATASGTPVTLQIETERASGFFLRTTRGGTTYFQIGAFGDTLIGGALDHNGSTVGFYGTTPIAKPTGVAVSAAGIHAALVALGLIAA